jgi:hypothetical protein
MSDLEAIAETRGAAAVEIAASALAERGHATGKCPNCSAPVTGAYCAMCGQERDTHRRSVWHLLGDLVEDIISFDSRILRTGVALMAEPGELAVAFREGRPQGYVPALRLYFFVSLIFFVILSTSGLAIVQFQVLAAPEKIVHNSKGYFIDNTGAQNGSAEPKLVPVPKFIAEQPGTKFGFSARVHSSRRSVSIIPICRRKRAPSLKNIPGRADPAPNRKRAAGSRSASSARSTGSPPIRPRSTNR